MLVDSVKLTEDKLELKLSVVTDKEAALDVCEVDGLKDQEDDVLVDSVKLAEEEILELKLSVLADKEAVLDA